MRYVAILALVLCASSVYAQDEDLLLASADTGNSTTAPLISSNERTSQPEARPRVSFSFDTTLRLPHLGSDNYWANYANQPRIIYNYEYEGLYGVAYKQIQRQASRFYDAHINNFWNQSYLHPIDFDRQLREFNLNCSDWGNRYWEQRINFWDNFPVEKGGARNQTIKIGQTYEIISVGPIQVSNTGRMKLSDWGFSVDREIDDNDLDRDIVDPDPRTNRTPNSPPRIRINDYALGIRPPRGNIYTGEFISVSGRVGVNLKLNTFDETNGSSVRGQLSMVLFTGRRNQPIMEVLVRVQAKPFREQYSAQIVVALLQW